MTLSSAQEILAASVRTLELARKLIVAITVAVDGAHHLSVPYF